MWCLFFWEVPTWVRARSSEEGGFFGHLGLRQPLAVLSLGEAPVWCPFVLVHITESGTKVPTPDVTDAGRRPWHVVFETFQVSNWFLFDLEKLNGEFKSRTRTSLCVKWLPVCWSCAPGAGSSGVCVCGSGWLRQEAQKYPDRVSAVLAKCQDERLLNVCQPYWWFSLCPGCNEISWRDYQEQRSGASNCFVFFSKGFSIFKCFRKIWQKYLNRNDDVFVHYCPVMSPSLWNTGSIYSTFHSGGHFLLLFLVLVLQCRWCHSEHRHPAGDNGPSRLIIRWGRVTVSAAH